MVSNRKGYQKQRRVHTKWLIFYLKKTILKIMFGVGGGDQNFITSKNNGVFFQKS